VPAEVELPVAGDHDALLIDAPARDDTGTRICCKYIT
jgi:hypothetical protein